MEMTYDGMLVMPSSYAVMDEEEMTYAEGGGLPRSIVATAIDGILGMTAVGAVMAPLKYLGKTAAKALIKRYAGAIIGALSTVVSFVAGMCGSVAFNGSVSFLLGLVDNNLSCCTSIGGIAALMFDASDKQGLNKWIGKKWW